MEKQEHYTWTRKAFTRLAGARARIWTFSDFTELVRYI
jgi:hypothetical protein